MDLLESAINWRRNSKILKLKTKLPCEVTEDDETSETVRCLWSFFRVFRIIGMCPVSRDGSNVSVRSKCHPTWYITWFALTLLIIMWINGVIASFPIEADTVFTGTVFIVINIIYYSHTLINCAYMIWKADQIPRFVNSCIIAERIFRNHQLQERTPSGIVRDSYVLLLFFYLAQLAGNILFYSSFGNSNLAPKTNVTLIFGVVHHVPLISHAASRYNSTSVSDFLDIYKENFVFLSSHTYSGALFIVTVCLYVDLRMHTIRKCLHTQIDVLISPATLL